MSILRLMAQDAVKDRVARRLPVENDTGLEMLLGPQARNIRVGAPVDGETAPNEPSAVSSALEVLARYFPTEVYALYLFGLGGLKAVQQDVLANLSDVQIWLGLIAISLALALFFVTVTWAAARRSDPERRYPWWPLGATMFALLVWAVATPGNPVVTTSGGALLAGFVAIFSAHLLSGLELIWGTVKRPNPTS